MSLGTWKVGAVVSVALSCAAVLVGCLGGDDTSVSGGTDAGLVADTSQPIFDAHGQVDGQGHTPTPDAGPDAEVDASDAGVDSAPPPPPPDGGVDAGVSIVGLVSGGTTSRSAHYGLTATAGPATGIVAHSANYQLVGGMAVSTQTVK